MKKDIFNHILNLDILKSNKLTIGQMTYSLFTDTEILKSSLGQIIFGGVFNIILLIIFTIYMTLINIRLALLIILGHSLHLILLLYFPNKIKKKNYEKKTIQESIINRTIEILNSLYLLKSCNIENCEAKNFEQSNEILKNVSIKENFLTLIFSELSGIITATTQFCVIGYGGYLVANNNLTFGELTAFIVITNMISSPLSAIVTVISGLQDSISSLNRIFKLLNLKNTTQSIKRKNNFKFNENISIKNLSFNYPSSKNILNGINIELYPNSIYSIIGKSGVGKTTLCMLLSNLYEPTTGSISIDGINIKEINLKSFRKNVGILLQNNFILSGSIKDNIILGNKNASDKDIINAAISANAHEFISKLPNGYNTQINSNLNLSGGQIQRIALARLFLQKPSIIILDEPTTFLDIKSEQLILKSIQKLSKNSTIIMITHKLETVKIASKVILLDEGTIKEIGSHEDLLNNSFYKKFYEKILC